MAGNGPAGRLKFKSRNGTTYDVGSFWNNGRGLSLSPQKVTEDGKYPKLTLAEAVARVVEGDGWLNVYGLVAEGAAPRQSRQEPRRAGRGREPSTPIEDDFDPDDCGF